jgi:hypothetical protein
MEPTTPEPGASNPEQNQSQPQPAPDGRNLDQMVVLQPGERVVCQIKRHPFGLAAQYVTSGIVILAAAAAAVFVSTQADSMGTTLTSQATALIYGALGLLVALALLILMVSNYIYWKNSWIVTSDSLTQILQPSLFGRQVSQLSLNDLEDVTVQQRGIFQTMFNFGTLRAETAGERSKFVFIYCPKPNVYARDILVAREDFMNGKRYTPQPRPRSDSDDEAGPQQSTQTP